MRLPTAATATAAGCLSASSSLDPYDRLKLAGSRISATENPMQRWAMAEEAGTWKARLMERTVQLAGVVVVHRRWTGVFAWSI